MALEFYYWISYNAHIIATIVDNWHHQCNPKTVSNAIHLHVYLAFTYNHKYQVEIFIKIKRSVMIAFTLSLVEV